MEIARETFEKLQQMVNRVVKSPRSDFYRAKFAKENFDPASHLLKPKDVIRIPRLARAELEAAPLWERCYNDADEIKHLVYTSGTSSDKPLLIFKNAPPRYRVPGKRPLFISGNVQNDVYRSLAPRTTSLPHFPAIIGSSTAFSVTAHIAEVYEVDAVIGFPAIILNLAKELSAACRNNIQDIFLFGEKLAPATTQLFKSLFPQAVLSLNYGTTETSLVGYQCEKLRDQAVAAYHSYPYYLLEITDQNNGAWRDSGGEGEIVITELYESPHQLIRYRTGDAGRIISDGQCSCGAAFTFEVTGRIDHDIIKTSGMMFRTDEIERVIKEFPEIEGDFRGVVETRRIGSDEEEIRFSLTIVLKQKEGIHPYFLEQLEQNFSERFFLTPSKTLADCIQEKRISSFDIFAIESFPFETKAQRLRLIEH